MKPLRHQHSPREKMRSAVNATTHVPVRELPPDMVIPTVEQFDLAVARYHLFHATKSEGVCEYCQRFVKELLEKSEGAFQLLEYHSEQLVGELLAATNEDEESMIDAIKTRIGTIIKEALQIGIMSVTGEPSDEV